MSDDLIERLRREAALQSEWHEWELNRGPAPAAMDMSRTAKLLREAAAELSRLDESPRKQLVEVHVTPLGH